MIFNTFKFLVLISVTVVSIHGYLLNSCSLNYEKDFIMDKPNLYIVTALQPGICRILSNESSSNFNYRIQEIPADLKDESPNWGSGTAFFNTRSFLQSTYMWLFNTLKCDANEGKLLYLNVPFTGNSPQLVKQELESRECFANVYPSNIPEEQVLPEMHNKNIYSIAYDWVTKYVYMNFGRSIAVMNIDRPRDFIIIVSDRKEIRDMVVHPNEGYLFFIDYNVTVLSDPEAFPPDTIETYEFYRVNLDGSNLTKIRDQDAGVGNHVTTFTIDYYTNRLYWITTKFIPRESTVRNMHFDGSNVKMLKNTASVYGGHYRSQLLAFDKDYVYYVSRLEDSSNSNHSLALRRFRKEDGKHDKDFMLRNTNNSPFKEIELCDKGAQTVREDHPCKSGSYDCNFCFAVRVGSKLSKVCKCGTGSKLSDDGNYCVSLGGEDTEV